MQKIEIRNFGPIVSAIVEIKPVLVLIGEQASGKSTIAKLIYFFKSISDDIFENFYQSNFPDFRIMEDLKFPLRNKFYDFFGSTMHLPNFNIRYYYDTNRWLELSLDPFKKLKTTQSPVFFSEDFQNKMRTLKDKIQSAESRLNNVRSAREISVIEAEKSKNTRLLSQEIDSLLNTNHDHSLYMIAGRESTISYGPTFESLLETTLDGELTDNRKKSMKAKVQTIDETLMIKFLKEMRRVKGVFNKYGGSFEHVVSNLAEGSFDTKEIIQQIQLILKGEYRFDEFGEKIVFTNNQYVFLKDASSGQKEAIRILQDIVLSILEQQNAFRVIEEPEAHLFPTAQKQLIEMLIYFKNSNPKNQLIITTHSPYILSVLNNLLFANRFATKFPACLAEISEVIPKIFHLKASDFAAYSLGNSSIKDAAYSESIIDEATDLIKQNYLDTVSEVLGGDFDKLYTAYARALKN
jgi:predicted ATP-dependent endonuclease of OLD family